MAAMDYLLRRALDGIRASPAASGMALASVAASVVFAGAVLLLASNAYRAVAHWAASGIDVSVYFRPDAAEPDVVAARSRIQDNGAVVDLRYVSQEEAWQFLTRSIDGPPEVLAGIVPSVLPASLEVRLDRDLPAHLALPGGRARIDYTQPFGAALASYAEGTLAPVSPTAVKKMGNQDFARAPVGAGPFKFVSFKQNEGIKLAKNTEYWKKGKPYLDGIEFTIVPNRGTAMLSFISGRFDIVFPWEVTIPLLKDIRNQLPNAQCQTTSMNNSTNLILNRDAPPFDNADLRNALNLAMDRKAFIDILNQGDALIGGVMQPVPDGVWGLPDDMLKAIPGYGGDAAQNREQARALMKKAGYGPDKHLPLKIATRGISLYKDPAVILAGQLKEIWIDAEVEIVETAIAHPHELVVGIGLDGNESVGLPATFAEAYALARRAGLRRTAHCCEDYLTPVEAPPTNYLICRDVLRCDRIDHGYNMLASEFILAEARRDGLYFTPCAWTSLPHNRPHRPHPRRPHRQTRHRARDRPPASRSATTSPPVPATRAATPTWVSGPATLPATGGSNSTSPPIASGRCWQKPPTSKCDAPNYPTCTRSTS